MASVNLNDVNNLISQLTLDEKITVLARQGRCRTTDFQRLAIPPDDV